MAYDFRLLKEKSKEALEWLHKECAGIRTGRATPALLDGIRVEAYGAPTPLPQAGSITIEDARTLRVTPWDKALVKPMEKAIADANLGVSVGADEAGVRVSFPELTSERREMLVKLVSQKLEDARILLRKGRDEVWGDIQIKEKGGELSEDEKFRYKNEMQKIVDDASKALEDAAGRKEKEIMS